ncbi:MAG: SprB repeat-containing protein [Saprospiraceae bacterium]|nr:SprB repeat-containing protein [Saprospiraceae bacterium]
MAGNYTVTVTDANSCTATQSATLTDPPAIIVQLSANDATCFGGDNGNVTSTVSGGSQPLDFLWNNNASTIIINNLSEGDYCLTVTDDNGCTSTACEAVEQPTELQLTTDPTNIGCLGTTGSVDLSVTGGTPSYQFIWDNGEATEDLSALVAGGYTVTVTDANNCSRTASVIIQQNDLANLMLIQTGVSCKDGSDGSIQASASGGAGSFTFAWSGPGGYDETTPNPTGLLAGLYYVTATDAIGCAITDSIEVTEDNVLNADFQLQDVSCFGEMDGQITVIPLGGQPPYLVSFDSAAFAGNTTFYNLDFGLYDLTIKDANGCEWTQEQIFIGEPKELRLDLGPDTILPYGTTLILNPNVANLTDPDLASFLWESNNPLMPPLDSSPRSASSW